MDERGIPDWAGDYIGLPYIEEGNTRAGVDCFGLIDLIHTERLGGPLPQYKGLHWHTADTAIKRGRNVMEIVPHAVKYASGFEEVRLDAARLGDGLMLRQRGHPIHCGLVLAPGWMIHATEDDGVCIEPYDGLMWKHRVLACYRRVGP